MYQNTPDFSTLVRTRCRIPSTRLIRPFKLQHLHILFTQFKIIYVSILFDPLRRLTLRKRNISLSNTISLAHQPTHIKPHIKTYLLQTPPNQHLRPSLPILFRDFLQTRFFRPLPPHQRTVCFNSDVTFTTPRHDFLAGQPRVDLPLSDIDGDVGICGLDVRFEFV